VARRKAVKPVAPLAEPEEATFLVAIQKDAGDVNTRAAYADWLDEHNRPYEAAVQRDKGGVSEVWYKLRRTTDGLFAEPDNPNRWTNTGKRWRSLKQLLLHVRSLSGAGHYLQVRFEDVEVVVIEVRPQTVGTLPVSARRPYPQWPNVVKFTIDEPVTPSIPESSAEKPAQEPPPPDPESRATRRRRR
jgi:uncharacterized protein (TIGR02996 family)